VTGCDQIAPVLCPNQAGHPLPVLQPCSTRPCLNFRRVGENELFWVQRGSHMQFKPSHLSRGNSSARRNPGSGNYAEGGYAYHFNALTGTITIIASPLTSAQTEVKKGSNAYMAILAHIESGVAAPSPTRSWRHCVKRPWVCGPLPLLPSTSRQTCSQATRVKAPLLSTSKPGSCRWPRASPYWPRAHSSPRCGRRKQARQCGHRWTRSSSCRQFARSPTRSPAHRRS